MQDNQGEAFSDLVTGVMGFYGKDVSDFQMDVWWETLRSYEFADVQRAFSHHCQDPDRGQFPPKPADINRLLHGGSGDRSLRGWSQVERQIRHTGPYQSLVFDDPVIHAVIQDMGGWIRLNEVTEEELPFKANEFRKRYQGYALRQPEQFPHRLIGLAESENVRNGREAPEPLLVGDPKKAQLVYQRGSDRSEKALPMSQAVKQIGSAA